MPTPSLPPPPPAEVRDVTIVRRLDQESTRFDRIWEPYIARWKDDILVAFSRRLAGKSDMGDVICARSTDQGKTWSAPVTVFDSGLPDGSEQYAYGNAVLFHPSGQNVVWCFTMRSPLYYPDSEDASLCAAFSTDGGLSWRRVPIVVNEHAPLIVIAGVMETRVDGRPHYLLPAQRNTFQHDPLGDRQQFVLESDNLLEWSLAGYVPQAAPAKVFLHEGNLAPGLAPGEIEIVMRTALLSDMRKAIDPPTAYSSVSRDGGHTWSTAKPEPRLYNTVAKGFYGADSKGRHIYVYNDGPAWARHGLMYVVQSPEGVWSEPHSFFFANTNNSYPTLIEESPGRWLCVWDSSTDPDHRRTAIRFGTLDLNE
jgi:hypothetical protein